MTIPAEPKTELNITDVVSGPIPPRVVNLTWPNKLHTRIADVVAEKGPPPWSVRLIADERNLVTLIANPPGTGNRPHWHKDFDEWWFVLAGTLAVGTPRRAGPVIEARKDEDRVGAARHRPPPSRISVPTCRSVCDRHAAGGALLQPLRAVAFTEETVRDAQSMPAPGGELRQGAFSLL